MESITVSVDPNPYIDSGLHTSRYLDFDITAFTDLRLLANVMVTGPVDGLWTITANTTQAHLEQAKDILVQYDRLVQNQAVLVAAAQAGIATNVAYLTISNPNQQEQETQIQALTKQSTAALRVLVATERDHTAIAVIDGAV